MKTTGIDAMRRILSMLGIRRNAAYSFALLAVFLLVLPQFNPDLVVVCNPREECVVL